MFFGDMSDQPGRSAKDGEAAHERCGDADIAQDGSDCSRCIDRYVTSGCSVDLGGQLLQRRTMWSVGTDFARQFQ